MRKFSIPYNMEDPDIFLNAISKYKHHIKHIFLGLPNLKNHFSVAEDMRSGLDSLTKEFLEKSKKQGYKRYIVINGNYGMLHRDDIAVEGDKISNTLKEIEADGIIVANISLAKAIRKNLPDIDIDTSSNCVHHSIKEMLMWQEEVGVHEFNAPRSAARDIDFLKEMKKYGLKIKLLVNESCLVGCPNEVIHSCSFSDTSINNYDCFFGGKTSNIFRRCYILPRWLKFYDDYVDTFKIAGRITPTHELVKTIDAYMNESECLLEELMPLPYHLNPKWDGYRIETRDIPDMLMMCKCLGCKNCNICDNLALKYFKEL